MVEYDPYAYEIHEDPYPVYRQLRDEAPAYYNEARDFWTLSRHADVLAAIRDTTRFSSAEGVALEDVPNAAETMSFLALDPPRHGRLRALVSRGFTPRRVAALEPSVRRLATQYIDSFVEDGACEFIRDFAGKLPMDVVSEMIGVPVEDRETLRDWAETVVHREEGVSRVPPAGLAAAGNLFQYFTDLVAARAKNPVDDLTGALLAAEIDGDRLNQKEVLAFLFLMIIAGNETTTKLLANALYWLWRNPEQRKLVREDPGQIPGWIEETLRFDGSTQALRRTLTVEVECHGVVIPKGAKVLLLLGSADRDERVFEDPDRYDVTRNTSAMVAFGNGTHFCLGASLARLEARVSLEELQGRLPDYEIDLAGLTRIHSSNVRGFASMPITFPT